MLQQIADLVEFDLNRFSPGQVIEDFNHKFSKSILKLDGQYYRISHAETDKKEKPWIYGTTPAGREYSFDKVKHIERVVPKTGLYSSEYGLLYLHRLPKRQWIKSLRLGDNYNYLELINNNVNESPSLFNTILVENPKYAKESIIHKDIVYLHWLKVGKVKDDILYVTNEKFFDEVKELWKHLYLITLDVKRPQRREENLQVDF